MPLPTEEQLYSGKAIDHTILVHKVAGANLGNYSPLRLVIADSAAAILDILRAPDFDARETAAVEDAIEGPIVTANSARVIFERGPRLIVKATAPGRALLVLPFEFSHCLEAHGTGLERILPVNLAQTGLLVEGEVDVEIRYRYGLIKGPDCRKADVERIKRLKLREAAKGRLFTGFE